MHSSLGVFQGSVSNRRCKSPSVVENEVFEADGCPGGVGGGGLGLLKEFLGGDLPLGPWNR